ncbi:ATP-binding protein [Halopseudomonas pachastrellae]|nr:ATP-binding protein [Halopseudomonas pachastrellae]
MEQALEINQPYAERYQVSWQLSPLPATPWSWLMSGGCSRYSVTTSPNAAKFSHAGGLIQVQVLIEGDEVEVQVVDQGHRYS